MAVSTPLALYQTYRSLDVPLYNGTRIYGIDIHEYRIRRNNSDNIDADLDTVKGEYAYHLIVEEMTRKYKRLNSTTFRCVHPETTESNGYRRTIYQADMISQVDLNAAFVGKGSPDQIRLAIRTAIHLGLLRPNRDEVQQYCDLNIGLDCSGFAKAYYGGAWPKGGISETKKKGAKITKLEDVRPGDALIWNNEGHVAVIDSIVLAEKEGNITYCLTCNVAESTADRMSKTGSPDGLNYTEYLLLFDGADKIKVMRPFARSRTSYDTPSVCVRRIG